MPAPSKAASSYWVLGFTAHVSGTDTTYCLYNDCIYYPLLDPIVVPFSDTITGSVIVDAKLGPQFFCIDCDWGPDFYSGTIDFDGAHLTGTDFGYTYGGTADTQGEIVQASAPKFRVYDIPGQPGPPAVPEPATWAMMLLGFGVLGFTLRRRMSTARENLRLG